MLRMITPLTPPPVQPPNPRACRSKSTTSTEVGYGPLITQPYSGQIKAPLKYSSGLSLMCCVSMPR